MFVDAGFGCFDMRRGFACESHSDNFIIVFQGHVINIIISIVYHYIIVIEIFAFFYDVPDGIRGFCAFNPVAVPVFDARNVPYIVFEQS